MSRSPPPRQKKESSVAKNAGFDVLLETIRSDVGALLADHENLFYTDEGEFL